MSAYKAFAIILTLLIVLRPHVEFIPDVISVYLFDLVIIAILAIISMSRSRCFHLGKRWTQLAMGWWVIAMGLLTVVLIQAGSSQSASATFVAKFILYGLFFLGLIAVVGKEGEVGFREHLRKALESSIWVVLGIALVQALQVPGVNEIAEYVYGTHKLKPFSEGGGRVYSSFYNANWFGVFSAIYLIYLVWSRRPAVIPHMLALCACILLSGSRTGVVIMLFGVFLSRPGLILVLSSAMFASLSLFSWESGLFKRFTDLVHMVETGGDQIMSLIERTYTWAEAVAVIKDSPGIGVGGINLTAHNSFLSAMTQVGVLAGLVSQIWLLAQLSSFKLRRLLSPPILALILSLFTGDYLESTQVVLSVALLSVAYGDGRWEPQVHRISIGSGSWRCLAGVFHEEAVHRARRKC